MIKFAIVISAIVGIWAGTITYQATERFVTVMKESLK